MDSSLEGQRVPGSGRTRRPRERAQSRAQSRAHPRGRLPFPSPPRLLFGLCRGCSEPTRCQGTTSSENFKAILKIRLFASLGTRGQTLHVPFPPWPGTQQQLGPRPGQAKAGVNPEFRMKRGRGEGTETPRPPSPSTLRGLQPPEMVSLDKCFKAATDGPIPPPPPQHSLSPFSRGRTTGFW